MYDELVAKLDKKNGKEKNTTLPSFSLPTFEPMNLHPPHGRRLWLFLVSAVILFTTGRYIDMQRSSQAHNFKELTHQAQDKLQKAEEQLQYSVNTISLAIINDRVDIPSIAILCDKNAKPGSFSFYVFDNDRLLFWSDNRIIPDKTAISIWKNQDLVNYKNGWFYVLKQQKGNKTVIGLLLVKNQYAYQNKYIINQFNTLLALPQHTALALNRTAETFPVYNKSGKYLFSIGYDSAIADRSYGSSAGCYLFAFAFAFVFILNFLVLLARLRSNAGLLLLALLAMLRWWMIDMRIPGSLYFLELFDSRFYASSFLLNSLGDLFLNTFVFALLIVYIYIYIGGVVLVRRAKVKQLTWSVLIVGIILLVFLFSVFINYLLSGLIINSQISFNINNVFELTTYSIIGIFIIGVLLFCFYLTCDGTVRFIQKTHFGFGYVSILFLIAQGFFLTLLIWLRNTEVFINYGVSAFLLANSVIIFITYVRRTSRRVFSFTRSLLIVFGFSIYAAQIINEFNTTKEQERRVLLASKMENEHDLVAEFLFDELNTRINRDTILKNFLALRPEEHLNNPLLFDDIQKYLLRQYFSGYLGKYDIQLKFFDKNDVPINRIGDPTWNLDAIMRQLHKEGLRTFSPGYYYLKARNGRISYTGIIPMKSNDKLGTIVIQANARLMQERSGLPELLLSSNISAENILQNYSMARYENNSLISREGIFNYNQNQKQYENYYKDKTPVFVSVDKFCHLFYKTATGGLIIISNVNQGLLVFITLFSYIFTFISILYVFIYLIVRLAANNLQILNNFKSRIQFYIVSIVIVALVMVGGSTITYIINNYSLEQNKKIREKLNSTLVLVQNEISDRGQSVNDPGDELIYAFNRLAKILSLDFNIYSTSGALIFTTQPMFYEQDLIAPLMNQKAFLQFGQNQSGVYLQNENIASFKYISAYEPIKNDDNTIMGYINLPYYARQTDLNREISSFLVALINIYVFLFSAAVITTFIISNRITEPLRIIQQGLKKTKLGRTNEPLTWKRNDEIGAMVNEYNRMVEELQHSAEKLARSERESAWREMAKQVAHEIKNPLTPMKLSVQHLQRAWSDNSPNLPQMVDRISATLIEQIDILSGIASAFSDFAKMPKANITKLELFSILENVVHLYSENENVKVVLERIDQPSLFILADKDYVIRVFSNLIKNAIQSIKADKPGLVVVAVETFIDHYVIAVMDNGQGISQEQEEKIFVPNFTTKSTGTGLGLAMVKTLVEGMNGEVWFETVLNKGTTFYVRLPSYHDTES